MSNSKALISFKQQYSLEQRKEESKKIKKKHPDRIPIIVELVSNTDLPPLDKKKFLVPSDLPFGQFAFVIRKRIKLDSEKSLIFFLDKDVIPQHHTLISQIYNIYKDDDEFLYVKISGENAFGSC